MYFNFIIHPLVSAWTWFTHGWSGSNDGKACSVAGEIRIDKISESHVCAEGPHWDTEEQILYFVDIPSQKFHCYDPASGKVTSTYIKNGQLGVAMPVAGRKNTFLGGAGTDIIEFTWDRKKDNAEPEIKVLAKVDVDRKGTRFNDGKIDPSGRFWGGTMGIKLEPKLGSLYRLDEGSSQPKRMISPVSISNGLVWSADRKTFYYTDSVTLEIWAYDYDDSTGDISNKRVLFGFVANKVPGIPDGITIDEKGNLWIACYDGGRVISVDSKTGALIRTLEIPCAKEVTSVAFGGPNLDILFVTTAKQKLKEEELKHHPNAGTVLAVRNLCVRGTPMKSYGSKK